MVDAEKGAGPSNAGPKMNQYEGMFKNAMIKIETISIDIPTDILIFVDNYILYRWN